MGDYSLCDLNFIPSEIMLGPVVSHVTLVNTYISQTHIDCLPIAHYMGILPLTAYYQLFRSI